MYERDVMVSAIKEMNNSINELVKNTEGHIRVYVEMEDVIELVEHMMGIFDNTEASFTLSFLASEYVDDKLPKLMERAFVSPKHRSYIRTFVIYGIIALCSYRRVLEKEYDIVVEIQ